MKQLFALVLIGLTFVACGSKSTTNDLAISNPIKTSINISEVSDDKLPVIINPGRFTQEIVVYRLPRVVQGTYAVSDFGSFVDDFKAIDYDGNILESTKKRCKYMDHK